MISTKIQRHSRGNEEESFILKQLYQAKMNFYLLQLFFLAFIIFYYQVVNPPNPQKNLTFSNVNKYKNPPLFFSCAFVHPPVLSFDAIHSAILTLSLKQTTSKRSEKCHNYDSSSSVVFIKCLFKFSNQGVHNLMFL